MHIFNRFIFYLMAHFLFVVFNHNIWAISLYMAFSDYYSTLWSLDNSDFSLNLKLSKLSRFFLMFYFLLCLWYENGLKYTPWLPGLFFLSHHNHHTSTRISCYNYHILQKICYIYKKKKLKRTKVGERKGKGRGENWTIRRTRRGGVKWADG